VGESDARAAYGELIASFAPLRSDALRVAGSVIRVPDRCMGTCGFPRSYRPRAAAKPIVELRPTPCALDPGFRGPSHFHLDLHRGALDSSGQHSAAPRGPGVWRDVAHLAGSVTPAALRTRRRALDVARRHHRVLDDGSGPRPDGVAGHGRANRAHLHAARVRSLCPVDCPSYLGGRRAHDAAAAWLHLRRVSLLEPRPA
jgi:hypothetical protein